MRTTATNKKIRILVRQLIDSQLIPDPSFQRRLVWSRKHKSRFIETVLMGLPFPEIYIAAGRVDAETGEGQELVVDGQQRLTTLREYFEGSGDIVYDDIPKYSDLDDERKREFLEYEVVVRDLGVAQHGDIKEVFERINSTRYALNAMEVHNARFEGAFKQFAETVAGHQFFEVNRVFNAMEVRRMADIRFCLLVAVTAMSTYFRRDDELETYLERYNDVFEGSDLLADEIYDTLDFISGMELPRDCRAWKKADLFTLIVEIHRALIRENLELTPVEVRTRLLAFYAAVDAVDEDAPANSAPARYRSVAIQATNDRSSRILRGRIVQNCIRAAVGLDAIEVE